MGTNLIDHCWESDSKGQNINLWLNHHGIGSSPFTLKDKHDHLEISHWTWRNLLVMFLSFTWIMIHSSGRPTWHFTFWANRKSLASDLPIYWWMGSRGMGRDDVCLFTNDGLHASPCLNHHISIGSRPVFHWINICMKNMVFEAQILHPQAMVWFWLVLACFLEDCPLFSSSPSCWLVCRSKKFLLGLQWLLLIRLCGKRAIHLCESKPKSQTPPMPTLEGIKALKGLRDKGVYLIIL